MPANLQIAGLMNNDPSMDVTRPPWTVAVRMAAWASWVDTSKISPKEALSDGCSHRLHRLYRLSAGRGTLMRKHKIVATVEEVDATLPHFGAITGVL